MVGSTLQVRTRTLDSPWQENVELKTLSAPDYSTIPPHQKKEGKGESVVVTVGGGATKRGSLGCASSSQENLVVREKSLKARVLLFLSGFLSSVGFEPDNVYSWPYAIFVSVFFAVLYWAVAWGSLHFVVSDFASVWFPNGVYVGAMLRSPAKARRVMVITMALSIYTVNLAWRNKQSTAAGFVFLNLFECLLITSIAFGLIRVFLPTRICMTQRKHLIAIGVAIFIGCAITGNLGTSFSLWNLNPHRAYGATYLKYIGRNIVGSALIVPLIICFPPLPRNKFKVPRICYQFIIDNPLTMLNASVLVIVLLGTPAMSAFLINGSALSAVGGLYITYPAVLYASAKFGVVGASYSSFFVGLSSSVCTLLFSEHDISPGFSDDNQTLSLAEQFIWMQLFLVVLISTSLFFVVILAERDHARTNFENKVHQRTEELTIALAQLDDALRKAETADNDKAVFFSFLCHELRNPLHVISNMANFLEDHSTDLPQIKAIKSSSKYMLALVSDVLDLGRFEAGRVVLENLTVDIHGLLQSNFDCAAQLAESHNIKFESIVDKNIPKWLSVDGIRLQQILNNLISNAFKFTPKGGNISVEVRALKVFHGVSPQTAVDLASTSLSARDPHDNKHRRGLSIASVTSDDVMTSYSNSSKDGGKRRKKLKQKPSREELEEDYFDVHNTHIPHSSSTGSVNVTFNQATLNSSTGSVSSVHTQGGVTISLDSYPDGVPPSFLRPPTPRHASTPALSLPSPLSPLSSSLSPLSSSLSPLSPTANNFNPSTSDANMRLSSETPLQKSQEVPPHHPTHSHSNSQSSTSSYASPSSPLSPASITSPLMEEKDGAGGDGGKEGDWVVLEVSVSDTGIGIDPSIVSKLFRPYAQAAVSTMREYGGSGLGLAITNQIVRLMGGSVYVETEIGKGSKFTFTVPLLIVHDATKASMEPTPPPEIISPLSPSIRNPSPPQSSSIMNMENPEFINSQDDDEFGSKSDTPIFHVLVVDDSSINRSILMSMLSRVLRKGSYELDIATNGQEAVDICQKKSYDLVFMDIVMPVMDGWEACRRIRENGFLKCIVITTANQVTGEAAAEIAAAGATDAISKPFSKEHIRAILLKLGAGGTLKT